MKVPKNISFIAILSLILFYSLLGAQQLPETGISGVYEVMVGTRQGKDAAELIRYFSELGFRVVDSSSFSAQQAIDLYGYSSRLTSYRLQNGEVDSHGLLRLLAWENPNEGVGYSTIETLGSRMVAARTNDVFRLEDIYNLERKNGKKWLVTVPIFDDLYAMTGQKIDFYNRPVGVREMGVYGDFFNHVFFQRYGYQIPGYGIIGSHSPLQISEFTHHDFVIKHESMAEATRYYHEALGMKPEGDPIVDGDWQKGPQRVFDLKPGDSHWYRGFVSPNNVCGKLKFFIPRSPRTDRTAYQRIGATGITLHSFYTPKIEMVYELVKKQNIKVSKMLQNEFKERSFVFTGPDGVNWQIIEKTSLPKFIPVTKFELKRVNN